MNWKYLYLSRISAITPRDADSSYPTTNPTRFTNRVFFSEYKRNTRRVWVLHPQRRIQFSWGFQCVVSFADSIWNFEKATFKEQFFLYNPCIPLQLWCCQPSIYGIISEIARVCSLVHVNRQRVVVASLLELSITCGRNSLENVNEWKRCVNCVISFTSCKLRSLLVWFYSYYGKLFKYYTHLG